jgi:hypothetical protein
MTTQQLYLFNALYLVLFVVVAILTRATARRIVGAVAGGAVAGVAALGLIALGEEAGWWHMAIAWEPHFLTLFEVAMGLSGMAFLITWRVARRFGWRGLAVAAVVAAVLGPVRDYRYMEQYPEWGWYAPGFAPVLAVSAAYVVFGVMGHAVMRLVASPARGSPLARRRWEAADPSAAADPARPVAFWDFKAPRGGPGS